MRVKLHTFKRLNVAVSESLLMKKGELNTVGPCSVSGGPMKMLTGAILAVKQVRIGKPILSH